MLTEVLNPHENTKKKTTMLKKNPITQNKNKSEHKNKITKYI